MSVRRRIGGVDIACDVVGEGVPALLLLHAFPFDRGMWRDNALELGHGRRVVTMDFRGFGESSPSPGPYSVDELADDAAVLLGELGVRHVAVCGLSLGGYVALAFARRHADKLASLVLADTKAVPDSPQARRARDDGIALVRARGTEAFLAGTLGRLLSPAASELLRARVRALGQQPIEAIAAALSALRDRPDATPELGRIRCPTLVLVGDLDAVTPPEDARALAAAIPGAKLVELPGAGHLANMEAAAAFNQEVADFLAR